MIYDWDKSDLATVAPYISAHYQPALERSRGKWGGMCGLGHEIQEASPGLTGNHTGGPTLRYDLYKQVSAPELSSLETICPSSRRCWSSIPPMRMARPCMPSATGMTGTATA